MVKKDVLSTIIYEALCPGLGFMYLNSPTIKNTIGMCLGIVGTFVSYYLVESKTNWRVTSQDSINEYFIGLILFFIFTRISVAFAMDSVDKYNKSVLRLKYDSESKQALEGKKIKSEQFILELSKYFKLKENQLIESEEFENKKNDLLDQIKLNGVIESKEEFLYKILELKEKNILNTEDIIRVKQLLTNTNT